MRAPLSLLLPLLQACARPVGPGGAEAAPEEKPGDSAPPDDSGAPPDTGPPPPPALRVAAELPAGAALPADLALSLVPVAFTGAGDPELGGAVARAAPDPALVAVLELPGAPPSAHLRELSRAHPGLQGALYAVVAHRADAGRGWVDGDGIWGLAFHAFALWIDPAGPRPEGWPGGWSVVDLGMAGMYAPNRCLLDSSEPLTWREAEGYPVFSPLDGGLRLGLAGVPAALELRADPDPIGPAADRWAGLPLRAATGEDPTLEPFFDGPMGPDGGVHARLDAAPPAAHDLGTPGGWNHAMEVVVPYVDGGDGSWGPGDAPTGASLCAGGDRAWLRYTHPVGDWRGARLLDCYGGTVGWRVIVYDDLIGNYRYLPPEAPLRLAAICAEGA